MRIDIQTIDCNGKPDCLIGYVRTEGSPEKKYFRLSAKVALEKLGFSEDHQKVLTRPLQPDQPNGLQCYARFEEDELKVGCHFRSNADQAAAELSKALFICMMTEIKVEVVMIEPIINNLASAIDKILDEHGRRLDNLENRLSRQSNDDIRNKLSEIDSKIAKLEHSDSGNVLILDDLLDRVNTHLDYHTYQSQIKRDPNRRWWQFWRWDERKEKPVPMQAKPEPVQHWEPDDDEADY